VRIVADVGGTNARFATLGASPRALERIEVMASADHPRLEDAIVAYIRRWGIADVAGVCLAVAGPAEQDVVQFPNSPWSFSKAALSRSLGAPLVVVNDFTAQALCIDLLRDDELSWVGRPRPAGAGYRAVIGPGTGLGVAVQAPGGEVVPSEGGHMAFAPTNEHEIELLRALHGRYGRVSIERVLSGPGLENLHWANVRLATGDLAPAQLLAPEVAALARSGDALARRSVEDFFDILAEFAGDVALMVWATGGVFLSGGVPARLMDFFDGARFRARFEDKGRFREFAGSVPIAWITAEYPGLLGCAAALAGAHAEGRAVS
jgi:glucokinase